MRSQSFEVEKGNSLRCTRWNQTTSRRVRHLSIINSAHITRQLTIPILKILELDRTKWRLLTYLPQRVEVVRDFFVVEGFLHTLKG
jgi:hypothetical protein